MAMQGWAINISKSWMQQSNFLYLNWNSKNQNPRLKLANDMRSTVEVTTSVGPYKNNYADTIMEKNNVYYWEIKIIKGNYFKIGVMKADALVDFKGKAFSDSTSGYAYYSAGKLRNGSNSTGTDFRKGEGYGPGDVIGVEFNTREGKLSFSVNGSPLATAFTVADFKKGGYVASVAALIEGSKYALTIPQMED